MLRVPAIRRGRGGGAAVPVVRRGAGSHRGRVRISRLGDILEALAGHPRIGARVSGQSAAEQSGVAGSSREALLAGNIEYEERFGHVFLICATGLSGEEMLAALRERLANDPFTERKVATAELRKITVLRARKALGS